MKKNDIYRMLPRVDTLMGDPLIGEMIRKYGYDCALYGVRSTLEKAREKLQDCASEEEVRQELDSLPQKICREVERRVQPEMTRVINGTGIILHTGLGRAPLGKRALQRAADMAGGYCNLEFDLKTGRRGERSSHFERILCQLTGAEAAMAVNNNAAAVLLMLSVIAEGGEVIVSRGELVEIGGRFRVPDMMELSGAGLKEEYGIPVLVDLGSGVLIDLEKYGLQHEPSVQEALAQGADVVTFSGDKLLGGPQAGIIAGKKEYIDKMKRHPLARVLRIDKFTSAALESVLLEYLDPQKAVENIPALRMLTRPAESVRSSAEKLAERLRSAVDSGEPRAAGGGLPAVITAEDCISRAGGGSLPTEDIPSSATAIAPVEITASELERRLRGLPIPVIGRIAGEKVLLDMRTIDEEDIPYLAEQFTGGRILRKGGAG